ncbi:4-hydroxybenzoate polyprenyltransferase [Arenibacter nanhaiticus]|uniref:4-hydroxybenzoate polyprenyltransferase n=1 Tax=Arenibacter nanhaiticus TaxID=558155 RepID=A0A1M6I3K1_9FLAO|nr:geranylgeranylglycerol-phosphate geranylgeranyltransferase [Arenibacter nanhaiticus]SHJ29081.1 4-hydroxybenzoate polyprenyltransferase [Arenibacter nanhaiticus]
MLNRKNKLLILKFLSLFSVVRGYNIVIIVLAQYLASIFILAHDLPVRRVVFDLNLLFIVIATSLAIAGGYIINNFYDAEKDLINKPRKSQLDRLVSQHTKLSTYFLLNFLSAFMASYVSFRAVVFCSAYIFGIWLYSHKLKKLPFLGNFVSATLAIAPFFAVFVYYKNFDTVIFVHATFLFLLILAREMIKDLENIAGDLAQNYKTIPILYGVKYSKIGIGLLIALSWLPSLLLIGYFDVGYMYLYFMVCMFLQLGFLILLRKSNSKKHYVWLHNILKMIIVVGVFSILLIDVDLVLNRIF